MPLHLNLLCQITNIDALLGKNLLNYMKNNIKYCITISKCVKNAVKIINKVMLYLSIINV